MKRLGGRHFALDDGARDPREPAVEVSDGEFGGIYCASPVPNFDRNFGNVWRVTLALDHVHQHLR